MSEKPKHTPGPWAVCPMTCYIFGPDIGRGEMVCEMRGHGYLTGVLGMSLDEADARGEANANLIAAAPDLLEAAELAADMLSRWNEKDASPFLTMERLADAITKARGER